MDLPAERTISTLERKGRKGMFLWTKEKDENEAVHNIRLEKAQEIIRGAKCDTLSVNVSFEDLHYSDRF